MLTLDAKRVELLRRLREMGSCVVAFSGGVDSAVVAKAAQLALGDRALAVTGVSASLASGELEAAKRVAEVIGIRHVELATDELQEPAYLRNAPDRCYHCKSELYEKCLPLLARVGFAALVNGANLDDVGDYRPGMTAAAERRVRSPLVECGIGKSEVRELARLWELPVWDKPATPCLSSRIAYGVAVTPERLAMIDQAEAFLRERGFDALRVRLHEGNVARIELPLANIGRLLTDPLRAECSERLRELGFTFVTVDLDGMRSGSLNRLIPLDALMRRT